MTSHGLKLADSRHDVQMILLPEKVIVSAELGTSLEKMLEFAIDQQSLTLTAPLIAAISDGRLRELTYKPRRDCRVMPITLASSDGGRIYRRSLVFLLVVALHELFPGRLLDVGYAVPDGGYFCEMVDGQPLTVDELAAIEEHMRHIVAADDAITKKRLPLEEARALFAARDDQDKVRLMEHRTRPYLVMYSLRGHQDYYFGYMVPSTRYLPMFRLLAADGGFILQYPRQEQPNQLTSLNAVSKLSRVFQQSSSWLEKIGVEDIGRLNRIVSGSELQEIILIAEALHEQKVSDVAQEIAAKTDAGLKIVTIAGPSSSGKTTFSKRLAIQLLALGIQPLTVELDNFFVDREQTPRDEQGAFDFESLRAINLTLFNDVMNRLLAGEEVQFPRFNFLTGRGEAGNISRLKDQQVIVLEGIHGLNTELFASVPSERLYRIYVSMLTQLNVDRHNRVPTTDVRMMRRIVRDARTRGYSAEDTLTRWQSVRRGEKRNIFPFQENADVLFNSALMYELAALLPLVEPLLLQVPAGTTAHLESNRLLSFLRWVQPMQPQQLAMIPDTSLLREFIGGSVLDSYHPGTLSV